MRWRLKNNSVFAYLMHLSLNFYRLSIQGWGHISITRVLSLALRQNIQGCAHTTLVQILKKIWMAGSKPWIKLPLCKHVPRQRGKFRNFFPFQLSFASFSSGEPWIVLLPKLRAHLMILLASSPQPPQNLLHANRSMCTPPLFLLLLLLCSPSCLGSARQKILQFLDTPFSYLLFQCSFLYLNPISPVWKK